MRILFYAVNGLGLGHVTRLLAIAGEIRRKKPDAQILFLTSSESDVIFREGFPSVKVPSKNIARDTGMSVPVHISILHQTAWSVFAAFRPQITVVDTFPFGFAHELDQVMRWESSRFVYIYRQRRDDKLDDPAFQSVLARYDLILVPHPPGVPGVRIPVGMPAVYTGNIVIRDRKKLLPAPEVYRRLGLPPGKKQVLINCGGGGQEALIGILGRIVNYLSGIEGLHISVARGSLLPGLSLPGCTIIDNYYPVCELYHAFDFAIAGCGYNTVHELLYLRKPGIYIPFERQVDDQARRAQEMEDRGFGYKLEASDLHRLPELVRKLMDPVHYARIVGNLKKANVINAARRAAREILRVRGSK